jgi:hypothetical protein
MEYRGGRFYANAGSCGERRSAARIGNMRYLTVGDYGTGV